MNFSADGQNQRKKYFNKFPVTINKSKRIKRKKKLLIYN